MDRRDGIDRRLDGESATLEQVYELVQDASAKQEAAHGRLRKDMNDGFSDLRAQIAEMAKQVTDNEKETLVIKTERRMEAKYAAQIGAIVGAAAGVVSSAVFTVLVAVFLKWTKVN